MLETAARRLDEAKQWLRHADAAAARVVIAPDALAVRLATEADIATIEDDFTAAARALDDGEAMCAAATCSTGSRRLLTSRSSLECSRRNAARCLELTEELRRRDTARLGADSAVAVLDEAYVAYALSFLDRPVDALVRSQALVDRLDDTAAVGETRARVLAIHANALSVVGRCDEALAVASEALALARRGDTRTRLDFLYAEANAALCAERLDVVLRMADDARADATAAETVTLAEITFMEAVALLRLGRPTAAMDRLRAARELLDSSSAPRPDVVASFHAFQASILRALGHPDAQIHEQRAREVMAAECGAREVVIDEYRAWCAAP
jgi:tetratricopeptide (TPR) repeat protein